MKRTTAPGSDNGFYVDEDRNIGRQGTAITAADRNAIQNELVNFIERGGLDPSAIDETQLAQATTRMILAARADGGRNIVGSGVAFGFEAGIAGAILTVAPGEGWDALGRRVALTSPATIDLAGTVGRPGAGNYKWVTFAARATGAVPNGIVNIGEGNEPHQFVFPDGCVVVAIQGAEVSDAQAAIRPDAGDDLLLADVLVDALTPWDALTTDMGRRRVVVRNDEVEGRIRSVATDIATDLARRVNNAVFPALIQATAQQLLAPDGAGGDLLGRSVAIDGDYVIVGAERDDVGASFRQGSAWVFRRMGVNMWGGGTQLLAPDGAAHDFFGTSVAIDGDYVIVGAHLDDVGANVNQGSAWVFRRTGVNTWDGGIRLLAPDGGTNDEFGASVAIDGDYAIVGAPRDSVGANGDQGSAWVFRRTGVNTWDGGTQLLAPDGVAGDSFGWAVAIDGDHVIVGARDDDVGANGFQGSAWVYQNLVKRANDALNV